MNWDLPEIAGVITAAGALLLFFKKVRGWIVSGWKYLTDAFVVPAGFVREFGPAPASRITETFRDLAVENDIDRLEVQILHRHLGVGVYICSPSGECIRANAHLCELFGMDRRDMLGYGWLRGVDDRDRFVVHAGWQYSVKHGLPYRAHYRLVHPRTGKVTWVKTEAYVAQKSGVITALGGYLTPTDEPASGDASSPPSPPAPSGDTFTIGTTRVNVRQIRKEVSAPPPPEA